MSYGLRCTNGANLIQIDQDYSNLSVVESVTRSVTPLGNPFNVGGGAIPQYLISPPYGSVLFSQMADFSFSVVTKSGPNYTAHGSYRYQPAYTRAASGITHGLRVMRADGSLAYDSGHFYIHPALTFIMPRTNAVVSVTLPPLLSGLSWGIPSTYLCHQFWAPAPYPQTGVRNLVLVFRLVSASLLQVWYAQVDTPELQWHTSLTTAPESMSITLFEV